MSPSNIPRSKSIKERVSSYLSKRINGDPVIDVEQSQRKSTEQRFPDLFQVLHAAIEQPPVKLGFRQRLMAELYAVFDSRDTIKRSSTTRDRRRHRQDSVPDRSASTPHRRRTPEHSSSLRKSSSIPRGRRHHRRKSPIVQRASSTGHHRKSSPPPQSPPMARDCSPPPLPRARSYRFKSFTTKPDISAPLALVNLDDHPALRNNANTPLTNHTDPFDRASFDVPPTLRSHSEQRSASQMPLHKRTPSQPRVDGPSHPKAPPGPPPRSVISTTTRWGDFISDSQPRPAAPRYSRRGSPSPAKFPSFSPAAHQPRAPAAPPRPSPRPSRSRGPVTCELCGGLSDPNTITYPDVNRHLCTRCARVAFEPPPPPPPPTPPAKDFAGFDFSTTGSQPTFSTTAQPQPAAARIPRPRPPSSEYSAYPAPSRYASNMGNPFHAAPPLPRIRYANPSAAPPEQDSEQGERARDRRSSFYGFYDDVLGSHGGR